MKFTQEQQEWIEDHKENFFGADLSQGFYWITDEEQPWADEGYVGICITPKEHFDENGYMYDDHTDVGIFMSSEDGFQFEEVAESTYMFEGTYEEVVEILEKYKPFFEKNEKIWIP